MGTARTALGVFIGGLAALFVHDALVGQRPPAPPPAMAPAAAPSRPVGDDSGSSTQQTPPPPAVVQAPQPAPAPPAAPPAPPPAPPPPAPPQAEASAPTVSPPQAMQEPQGQKQQADDDLKKAQALAARLEAERQQRRADAWARYFQPSPVCRADPTTRPCADAHLAARKRFDAQYVDR